MTKRQFILLFMAGIIIVVLSLMPRVVTIADDIHPTPISTTVPVNTWNWTAIASGQSIPDPSTLKLPVAYKGNLPALPIPAAEIIIPKDIKVSAAQMEFLAENGFVIVPANLKQFSQAYPYYAPSFITTDSMLYALHLVFDDLLIHLEKIKLAEEAKTLVGNSLKTAVTQYQDAKGKTLEKPARNAVLYLAIALELFAPGEMNRLVESDVAAEANKLVEAVRAASGQIPLAFMDEDDPYIEDFSQYRPRGHYAGDVQLEAYFRGMMWLSHITFRIKSDLEAQTSLLLLRALLGSSSTVWAEVHEILGFLIGPIDDLSPVEYGALALQTYGADLPLNKLGDLTLLNIFREHLSKLPGPRINGLVLPAGTQASQIKNLTQGFRFMGQRFTLDGYFFQQLTNPHVKNRPMPTGLDIPTVFGSETAYSLVKEAGVSEYPDYAEQINFLRTEVEGLTAKDWQETAYGSWLWSLQPLWKRDPEVYPPMMQRDAWLRHDLQVGLASWTLLKHDTLLYIKQPVLVPMMGIFIQNAVGYVEPNPLVFARIAETAGRIYLGMDKHKLLNGSDVSFSTPELKSSLYLNLSQLRTLTIMSARFAEYARKELAGEDLTKEEMYTITNFGQAFSDFESAIQKEGEPIALVADVYTDIQHGQVLQAAVGNADLIYVILTGPDKKLYLSCGGVFSYYEFNEDINKRMTDAEWRGLIDTGRAPPRPSWVMSFTRHNTN